LIQYDDDDDEILFIVLQDFITIIILNQQYRTRNILKMYPLPKTRREEFIEEITALSPEKHSASLAGAIYDFRFYTKIDIRFVFPFAD
jgi:hypothetical protein